MPQAYVYSISQDSLGNLWIGTGEGLSRYNGFTFDYYSAEDSLADNFITCSFNDGKCIWFGHRNGGITLYNGSEFIKLNTREKNLSQVTHFAKSPDGRLWVSTFSDGLFMIDRKDLLLKNNILLKDNLIYDFEFLPGDEMLVGTDAGLRICRADEKGVIHSIIKVVEIPESRIVDVKKMTNNEGFYIATENEGIYNLQYENSRVIVSKIKTDPLFETGIQSICEDTESNLWLASFGNGLIKLTQSGDKVTTTAYNKSTGFAADNVKFVFKDREGIIWSGNYGDGLAQVTPKVFSHFEFDRSMYGSAVFSICSDQNYRWLGTEKGLLKTNLNSGKVIRFYGDGKGLPRDTITAIYAVNGNELWIGTDKNGTYILNTKTDKIVRCNLENGFLENSINVIAGDEDNVWIGTKKGLCIYNLSSGMVKTYSLSQGGLPHNYINSLYEDKEKRLWITTKSSFLTYIQDGNVLKKPLNTGAGMITLGPVTKDEEDRIWVGSNGNGIFIMEEDSIVNLTTKQGLLSDYCYSLLYDGEGNIWAGHKGGLSRIRISDFSIKLIKNIENADNFRFNLNAATSDPSGKIWFGSDKGLVCYDPSMELSVSEAPILNITSVRINDKVKNYSGNKIILSPGNYKIRIDFLGSSLKDPSLVSYQSKLEGYDQWSEITKNNYVTYNRVPDGEYKFILKASGGDGIVTEIPLELNFVIEKPVWEYWWFYAVLTVTVALLVFLFIKRRERRFLKEKRILEEKVLERTREIQAQKNEIEVQRDEINRKNSDITSSITYASHIQSAVLPPNDLIDKLFPENFIMNKPKDIVSGDFYWMTEKNKKIIFAVADCTGHGVPGAFMSCLGITLLNEIVNIHGITKSDAIISTLRKRVIQSLRQNSRNATMRDGMDITLCVLDPEKKKLQFTGAMNDMVFIRDGRMNILKADHLDVSISYLECGEFRMKELNCRKGDMIYLFSDGYQDQFGGTYNKKFLRPHFYTTLFEIHRMPVMNQKEMLEKKLNEWMKKHTQTDDITVMGIRI